MDWRGLWALYTAIRVCDRFTVALRSTTDPSQGVAGSWSRHLGLVDSAALALRSVRFATYLVASIMGAVLLGIAGLCAVAAGRNHLSPWWVPAYVSLLTAFALIAETTAPGLGIS